MGGEKTLNISGWQRHEEDMAVDVTGDIDLRGVVRAFEW